MLVGKYLSGRHYAGLKIVVEGYEHRHQRNQGLAAANITLQQPVHLLAGAQVGTDLTDNPLLCIGELKAEVLLVKCVGIVAHICKGMAIYLFLPAKLLFEQPELDIKQLFEL